MPVQRKQINTNLASVSCDVCGRSLLRGEYAAVFIFQGSRRNVCDLCTVRAAHDGWIREGVDDVLAESEDRPKRIALRDLIRQRRSENDLEPGGAEALLTPEPQAQPPEPDNTLYEERSVRGIPSNVELKVSRAFELFNQSPHKRTVGGVSKTLGTPVVSAAPSLTEGSVVTIVVAWELSWYRFEVDLGDEASGIRVVGKGTELADLEAGEQHANGFAAADGTLQYEPTPTGTEL